ncbi:MAG: hypothetical protein WDM81_06990 [Rhizomicrobium sp.]
MDCEDVEVWNCSFRVMSYVECDCALRHGANKGEFFERLAVGSASKLIVKQRGALTEGFLTLLNKYGNSRSKGPAKEENGANHEGCRWLRTVALNIAYDRRRHSKERTKLHLRKAGGQAGGS